MWQSIVGGGNAQGMDWDGINLRLAGSSSTAITIPAADLTSMLQAALDSAVKNENRSPGGDRFKRQRDAIGGAAGATHTGHTYSRASAAGVRMTRTSGTITFDIGDVSAWAVSIASLCQSSLADTAGQLQRA